MKEIKEEWIDDMVKSCLNNEEQLRKELSDFYDLIRKTEKIFEHVSRGMLSKPTYTFKTFKEVLEENYELRRLL